MSTDARLHLSSEFSRRHDRSHELTCESAHEYDRSCGIELRRLKRGVTTSLKVSQPEAIFTRTRPTRGSLIAAGADVNAASRQGTTPLLVVARVLPSHLSAPLLAVLLRGGATLDPRVRSWSPYLEKVHDAGGWKRYAQVHRKHLAAMFASKLGLPADVLFLVVDFWGAHVGMYAFDAGATKEEVENVEEHGRKSGPCTIS